MLPLVVRQPESWRNLIATVARVSFWSEIRRSRSKKEEAQPSAMAIQEGRGPDTQKVAKPGESRF